MAQRGNLKSSRSDRLGNVEREVLESLTLGDLTIGFLCSARSTKRMMRIAHERARHRYRRRLAIDRLTMRGLVSKKGDLISIKEEGKRILSRHAQSTKDKLRTSVWDHKWRIVTFDIPESHRRLRYEVRAILRRAGFKKLHQSLWVFPHECEELTQLVKKETNLSAFILYGVLERIENDMELRKSFSLD